MKKLSIKQLILIFIIGTISLGAAQVAAYNTYRPGRMFREDIIERVMEDDFLESYEYEMSMGRFMNEEILSIPEVKVLLDEYNETGEIDMNELKSLIEELVDEGTIDMEELKKGMKKGFNDASKKGHKSK